MGDWEQRIGEALPGYDIGGEIGRGAWGVVVRAVHRQLGREVAIKQLPPAFAAEESVRRRFVAEARLLATLDHSHIVPIFDYVEQDGLCLLVMEYLAGGTVWQRFTTSGLTMEAACSVALATAGALGFAHDRGILHRDVKPENLLFTASNVVKVSDFGIAKIAGGNATMATVKGEVLGTPAYMAPEQAMGQALSPATDLYAVGTVLFELLSGRLPFEDDGNALAVLHSHVYETPAHLDSVAPDVPEDLCRVVMRCLAKDPRARYQTAEELGIAIADATTAVWGPRWPTRSGLPIMASEAVASRLSAPRPQVVSKRDSSSTVVHPVLTESAAAGDSTGPMVHIDDHARAPLPASPSAVVPLAPPLPPAHPPAIGRAPPPTPGDRGRPGGLEPGRGVPRAAGGGVTGLAPAVSEPDAAAGPPSRELEVVSPRPRRPGRLVAAAVVAAVAIAVAGGVLALRRGGTKHGNVSVGGGTTSVALSAGGGTTSVPRPPLPAGNLVVDPGAEDATASAPFTVGEAPAGWQRGHLNAIAVNYGAVGQRPGCSSAGYPAVNELHGSGAKLFTGGFDSNGGCGLPAGSTPTLTQVISLAPYGGRVDGAAWKASALLASYPGSGDGAQLTVESLGGGDAVLKTVATDVVSNPPGSSLAFQMRALEGTLPAGTVSVRITLSFPVAAAYSGGFADDVSFSLG